MPLPAATLHYPHQRVLLSRTRLAYVHLRNLLTDAKRERTAKVYGYVSVWLPEELLLLFMQEGEVVNVTATANGHRFRACPIAEAVSKVPREAEIGEICFHEADDEQLATMYWSQLHDPLAWPEEMNLHSAARVYSYLNATMHDGVLEVRGEVGINYGIVRNGRVSRGYFSDLAAIIPEARLAALLDSTRGPAEKRRPRLWPVPPPLPVQPAPQLIQAYRDLVSSLVGRLVAEGAVGAPAVAEHARLMLAERHPVLERFSLSHPNPRDPVTETPALSAAVGAWLGELLLAAAPPDGKSPGRLIGDLTRDRKHVFQSAGLYDALPWRVEW